MSTLWLFALASNILFGALFLFNGITQSALPSDPEPRALIKFLMVTPFLIPSLILAWAHPFKQPMSVFNNILIALSALHGFFALLMLRVVFRIVGWYFPIFVYGVVWYNPGGNVITWYMLAVSAVILVLFLMHLSKRFYNKD